MLEKEVGLLILTLGVFLAVVHTLGYLFERLRQPQLVGEIVAGALLGPFVLGWMSPRSFDFLFANPSLGTNRTKDVLGFVYWLGVLFLMFNSGSQVRRLLAKENRRETAWLLGIGTPLPFILVLMLGSSSMIPLDPLVGAKGVKTATLLVLASAVAVTSIPVISRIFSDLGILHTRFASTILGSAVLEDVALWGVLAVATALTQQGDLAEQGVVGASFRQVLISFTFMAAAILALPPLLARIRRCQWNFLYKASPLAYAVFVLFAYVGLAATLGVNLVFAAFLAGFGIVGGMCGSERVHFAEPLDAINKFSSAVFIPIYFALVGHRLVLGREFSPWLLVIFSIGSSLLALASVGFAAKLAGFKRLDIVNLAVTSNARGGPGIVLASVAYDAGIISGAFYTALVLAAILTSQIAGLWLRYVISKGWPLLSTDPDETILLREAPPQAREYVSTPYTHLRMSDGQPEPA